MDRPRPNEVIAEVVSLRSMAPFNKVLRMVYAQLDEALARADNAEEELKSLKGNEMTTNSAKLNLGASNSPLFQLQGGRYGIQVLGTFGGGSVDLQVLGPDDLTYQSVLDTPFIANGVKLIDAPPSTSYKFVVATATNVFASVYPV